MFLTKNVSICSLDHMYVTLASRLPCSFELFFGEGQGWESVLRGLVFIPGSSVLLQNPKCVPKLEVKTT